MSITLPKVVGKSKRIGRGIGRSGAKSGRGMKGQRSRAGSHQKAGFEGGQTPLYMRLPKGRGTKQTFSPQKKKPTAVMVGSLSAFPAKEIVGLGALRKAGLLPSAKSRVKLVGGGSISKALTVRVHAATKGAREAVEQAGGKIEIIADKVSLADKKKGQEE